MNFGPQTVFNRTVILPILRKCCLLLRCQASQRKITGQNSTIFWDMLEVSQFANTRESLKIEELETAYFDTVFNSTKLCKMPKQ